MLLRRGVKGASHRKLCGVLTCPACGTENLDASKFCTECGERFGVEERSKAEERKVVTVLFCDLVGFTARSDAADPEDVRAILRPYHALLKDEVERYGGTVEKFIGDGVMAVFGAPVAHEDDPERAVRAALRILRGDRRAERARPRRWISRCGWASTPARRWSARRGPGPGERSSTGDVVNTASRLQARRARGGIVVGEATTGRPRAIFEYRSCRRSR